MTKREQMIELLIVAAIALSLPALSNLLVKFVMGYCL